MNHIETVKNFVFQKSTPLSKLVGADGNLSKAAFRDHFGDALQKGLYAFVWVGPVEKLQERKLKLVGVGGKKAPVTHEIQWLHSDFHPDCKSKNRFPLYIGKTSTIYQRIRQHLELNVEDWRSKVEATDAKPNPKQYDKDYLFKRTTACQFRSGLEHLFELPSRPELLAILEHIELVFHPIADDTDGQGVKDRFYLEDLAIGYFRPWFNVDSER
jgi:hypothetical protein